MPARTRAAAAPPGGWTAIPVTVEKRKWDGSVSARWDARLMERRPGRWVLETPAGTLRARPRAGGARVLPHREVTVGSGGPWLVTFAYDAAGRLVAARADAVLPPAWAGPGLVTFTDLDLDLEIDVGTGASTVRDEEDLARNGAAMAYPAAVVASAWEGIREVRERLERGRWPFTAPLWTARSHGAA